MNATRIVDLVVYGLMSLALIAGIVWLIHTDHPWWALAFMICLVTLRPDYRTDCNCDEEK